MTAYDYTTKQLQVDFRICPVTSYPESLVMSQESPELLETSFAGFHVPELLFRVRRAMEGLRVRVIDTEALEDELERATATEANMETLARFVEEVFPAAAGSDAPTPGDADTAFRISDPSRGQAQELAPLATDNKPGSPSWVRKGGTTLAYEVRVKASELGVVDESSASRPFWQEYDLRSLGAGDDDVVAKARYWAVFSLVSPVQRP